MAIQPPNRDLAFKTFEGRSMMRLNDLRTAGVTSVTLRRMQTPARS
jgi:predicted methyltransferase